MQVEDKLQLKAMLASAVGNGLMVMGVMKNKDKTNYWYFNPTEVKKDGK